MLKHISGFAANALLSAGIGFLVGLVLIIVLGSPADNRAQLVLMSTGIGILIGVASRFSCCFIQYRYGFDNPFWSYALTFLITLLGCTIPSFPPDDSSRLLLCIIIAEPLALMATYLNLRYAGELNDSLKRKQAQLTKR
jgi:hypothetical protein